MGAHLTEGEFQSDKYPDCPRGFVPLKLTDVTAQDLIWEYANRRRSVDPEFADDLIEALRLAGYEIQGRWLKGGIVNIDAARTGAPDGFHECRIVLNHKAIQLLERLVETGLFGSDPSAAARRLIEMALEDRFFIEEPDDFE